MGKKENIVSKGHVCSMHCGPGGILWPEGGA